MRTENTLRWVAISCAIFMLFGPFADRTSWGRGSPTTTDSAGYNFAALGSGVVALAALAIAFRARPRMVLPVLATSMFGSSTHAETARATSIPPNCIYVRCDGTCDSWTMCMRCVKWPKPTTTVTLAGA